MMEERLVYTINDKEYVLIDELIDNNRNFMYLIALDQSKALIIEKIVENEEIIFKSIEDDSLFEKIATLFAKKLQKEINS